MAESTEAIKVSVVRARRDRVTGWATLCSHCGLLQVGHPEVVRRKAQAVQVASHHVTEQHAGDGLVRVPR